MASGDGHVGGGRPDPREIATGAGADPAAAILAPQAAARMAVSARALIGGDEGTCRCGHCRTRSASSRTS
jgi:hypothetical protein